MPGPSLIREAGPWRLVVEPELGGGIRSLRFDGKPVLLEDPAEPDPVLALGCFPMLPFANRIRDGVVHLPGGSTRTIAPYGIGEPVHPLHGTGWRARWSVEDQEKDPSDEPHETVVLRLNHVGDRFWPWPFEAHLVYTILQDMFIATLVVASTSGDPIPASIGLHPWFPAADARLSLQAGQIWAPDGKGVCATADSHSGFEDAAVADLDLDHCLTGWNGKALIKLGGRAVEIISSAPFEARRTSATGLHLYTPPGRPRFCLEPQTARSGAFDQPPGTEGGPDLLQDGGHDLVLSMVLRRRPDRDG